MKLCCFTGKIFSKLADVFVTCYQLSRKSNPVFGTEEAAVDEGSSFWNYKTQRQCRLLKTQNVQVSSLMLNRRYMRQCSLLSETKYSPFVLTDKEQHGDNTFLYTFKVISAKSCALGIQPGQHMYLRSDEMSQRGWLERPYSVIQSQTSCSCMEVLIYLSPTGSMTNWIKRWHLGRIIWWRGPLGLCPLKGESQRLALMAQGTGISPMIGVIRHVLCNPNICVKLFFCTSNHCNIYFRKELNKYLKYSNFSYDIFLSNQQCPFDRLCKEKIYEKMLDGNHLKCYINNFDDDNCQFLICGDINFKKFIVEKLECFGIKKDYIHKF